MLENLSQRLARVVKTMRGEARLTEANTQEMLREIRVALLEADVALPVVRDFIARVKDKALGQDVVGSLTPGQALVGVVHRELAELMGGTTAELDLATQPPEDVPEPLLEPLEHAAGELIGFGLRAGRSAILPRR